MGKLRVLTCFPSKELTFCFQKYQMLWAPPCSLSFFFPGRIRVGWDKGKVPLYSEVHYTLNLSMLWLIALDFYERCLGVITWGRIGEGNWDIFTFQKDVCGRGRFRGSRQEAERQVWNSMQVKDKGPKKKTRVQAMMGEVEMDREKWSDSDIKRERFGKTASLPLL